MTRTQKFPNLVKMQLCKSLKQGTCTNIHQLFFIVTFTDNFQQVFSFRDVWFLLYNYLSFLVMV